MTSAKYLDSLGVSYLWAKIKNYHNTHTYSRATDGSNEILADDNTNTIQISGDGGITATLAEDATSHNAKFTIASSSKAAANGGTDLSMVTTGEKYTWNNKQDAITSSNKLSADLIQDGTTNKAYTAAEKTKLAGIAEGAQINQNAYGNIGIIYRDGNENADVSIPATTTTDIFTFDFGSNIDVNLSTEDKQVTLNSKDTKNTTGSTNDAAKLFLVGAKTQAANPVTYSQANAYITAGKVYSNAKEVVNLSDIQQLTNKNYNGINMGVGTTTILDTADPILYPNGGGTLLMSPSTTLRVPASYTLAAACAKGVDTTIAENSTSTNLPTTAAVEARIRNAISAAQAGAAMYQGAAPTTFTPTNYKSGYYWIVRTAGTYAGQTCEPGDMIFANTDSTTYNASHFDVIQTNLDIASMTNSEIDAATDQTPNPS